MLNERDVVTELLKRIQLAATGAIGPEAGDLVQRLNVAICAAKDVREKVDMLARVEGFERFATRLQWVLESARLDGSMPRGSVLALEARSLAADIIPVLERKFKNGTAARSTNSNASKTP